jgi:hypothetical protein
MTDKMTSIRIKHNGQSAILLSFDTQTKGQPDVYRVESNDPLLMSQTIYQCGRLTEHTEQGLFEYKS